MTHCAPLETHGFPTLTPLAAFLPGNTTVFPTPFERFAQITRTEFSNQKSNSVCSLKTEERLCRAVVRRTKAGTKKEPKESVARDSHNSFQEFCRIISTPRLKTLLPFHLVPINVVISHDPITIPNLGVGFPLRCFQRLSNPDIATGRCTWRYSPQTRGQFVSVLSY